MDTKAAEKFRTHRNYIRAFACLFGWQWSFRDANEVLEEIRDKVRDSASFTLLQRLPVPLDPIRDRLRSAWGTELLLALAGTHATDDELVRFTNTWGVVQLYYAAHHAVQAQLLAKGLARPSGHEVTKKQYLNLWVKPARASGLAPLCLAWGPNGASGLPVEVTLDDDLPNWGRCDNDTCWTLCLRAMRTTREEELRTRGTKRRQEKTRERRTTWDREEQARIELGRRPRKKPDFPVARLAPADKSTLDSKLREYSMLDYLYRLRIKANYEDAGMFTDGPDDDEVSKSVHADLVNIAAAAMLVHELHIRQLVGATVMKRWLEEWVKANPIGLRPMGLAARANLILKAD